MSFRLPCGCSGDANDGGLEIVDSCKRANPAADIADESFVCGTVTMLAITALDDEQSLERMTSDGRGRKPPSIGRSSRTRCAGGSVRAVCRADAGRCRVMFRVGCCLRAMLVAGDTR